MDRESYQPYFERLIAFGSTEDRTSDLLAAKAEFFSETGEVFEDDKSFEPRMASFLDFYLMDRPGKSGKTPAQELHAHISQNGTAEEASAFRAFTETLHGLFEIRKSTLR